MVGTRLEQALALAGATGQQVLRPRPTMAAQPLDVTVQPTVTPLNAASLPAPQRASLLQQNPPFVPRAAPPFAPTAPPVSIGGFGFASPAPPPYSIPHLSPLPAPVAPRSSLQRVQPLAPPITRSLGNLGGTRFQTRPRYQLQGLV